MSELHPLAVVVVCVGGLITGLIDWEEWPIKLLVFVGSLAIAMAVQLWG